MSTLTKFKKLTKSDWNVIEREVSPFEKRVLLQLLHLGDPHRKLALDSISQIHVSSAGDNVYVKYMRPILVENGVITKKLSKKTLDHDVLSKKSTKSKKNQRKKKGLTREEIIHNNLEKTSVKTITDIIQSMKTTGNVTFTAKNHLVEIRVVGLLVHASRHLSTLKTDQKPSEIETYELIIGFLKSIDYLQRQTTAFPVLVEDCAKITCRLCKSVQFSYETMFEKYPRLIFHTMYDLFPNDSIRPYDSQKELLAKFNHSENCFLLYRAMIGSGKTSSITALIAGMSQSAGSSREETERKQLLFCCCIRSVRLQVGAIAYNSGIHFAHASIRDKELTLVYHWTCSAATGAELVIADLTTTLRLLQEFPERFYLFIDEPTVKAECNDISDVTRCIGEILRIAPSRTILSSATLPASMSLRPIIESFSDRFQNVYVSDINSTESRIGCQVITSDGTLFAPHMYCKNTTELSEMILKIRRDGFISRLYTAPLLYRLNYALADNRTKSIDLEEVFSNISAVNQTNVQEITLDLLEELAIRGDDVLMRKVFEKVYTKGTSPFDKTKLFTEDAWKYTGGCLIACHNPVSYVMSRGKLLLTEFGLRGGFEKLLRKYEANLVKYEKSVERMKQKLGISEKTLGQGNSKKFEKLSEQLHDRMVKLPDPGFPRDLQINTAAHLAKYFTRGVSGESVMVRSYVHVDALLKKDLGVSWELMELLYCGVGCFVPRDPRLSRQYTSFVMAEAEKGNLAFLVSGMSISYGTNYPFSHVVITDELVSEHSIGTIFQLMGRAGRVGKSWTAQVHATGELFLVMLLGYVKSGNDCFEKEAENIVRAFIDESA